MKADQITKLQYSKEQLIQFYRPRTIDQLANGKQLLSLSKQLTSLIKTTNQVPVNFHSDQLIIKGYNQEILVYSSNTPTPLKTVGAQAQDQFRFDEQIYTPQPTASETFFPVRAAVHKPIFSHSRQMRFGSLESMVWFYIDDSNNVQGPFSTIEMDCWYTKGFFDDRTEVAFRNKHAESFLKLKHFKMNKFLRGEKRAYKQVIGRRRSAPQRISQTDAIQSQGGPQTAVARQEVNNFQFPDVQTETPARVMDDEVPTITPILSIPTGKLGRNKKGTKQ